MGINLFKKTCLLIALTLLLLSSSCGKQYSHSIALQSVLKDNVKIKAELIVFVNNQKDLDVLINTEKKIKQAFFIIFREYRSDQLGKTRNRTTLKVIQRILDSKLRIPVKKFEVNNYELIERQ